MSAADPLAPLEAAEAEAAEAAPSPAAGDEAPKRTRATKAAAKRAPSSKGKSKANNAAPVRSARKRTGAGRTGRPSEAQLRAELVEAITKIAGLLVLAGLANPRLAYDARVLMSEAEGAADELLKLAKRYPQLGAALEGLLGAAEAGSSVAVLVSIAFPIAVNHGLLPPAVLAVPGVRLPDGERPAPPAEADDEAPASPLAGLVDRRRRRRETPADVSRETSPADLEADAEPAAEPAAGMTDDGVFRTAGGFTLGGPVLGDG